MTTRSGWRTVALVILGLVALVALAACVPVAKAPPPPPTAPPPPPNPCAAVPAQSGSSGTDYVAVTDDGGKVGVHKFHAGTPAERDQQVAQLAQSADVVSVAPDQTVHAAEINDPLALPPADPPDPESPNPLQWGVYASHFPDAWSVTQGSSTAACRPTTRTSRARSWRARTSSRRASPTARPTSTATVRTSPGSRRRS
jgi:hypothetical protein